MKHVPRISHYTSHDRIFIGWELAKWRIYYREHSQPIGSKFMRWKRVSEWERERERPRGSSWYFIWLPDTIAYWFTYYKPNIEIFGYSDDKKFIDILVSLYHCRTFRREITFPRLKKKRRKWNFSGLTVNFKSSCKCGSMFKNVTLSIEYFRKIEIVSGKICRSFVGNKVYRKITYGDS